MDLETVWKIGFYYSQRWDRDKNNGQKWYKIKRFCIRYRFSKSSFCLYVYYHQKIIYLLNHCTCKHLENCTRCGKYFYPLQWAVIDNCTDTIKWKYDSFGSVYFTKSVFLILKKYDIPDVNLFDRVKLRAWSPLLPGSEVKYFRPSIDDAKASLKAIGSYLVIGGRCLFFLLKLKKTL